MHARYCKDIYGMLNFNSVGACCSFCKQNSAYKAFTYGCISLAG